MSHLVPKFKLRVFAEEKNLTWSKEFSFYKMVGHTFTDSYKCQQSSDV